MGTRTKVTTKGIDAVKTPAAQQSDFVVEVPGQVNVPWVWRACQRQQSIDIVDGQATFTITSSVTLATPVGASTGILPGITGSWAGQMFTVSKMGVQQLTISASNVIKGTVGDVFTMVLTGSQYHIGGGTANSNITRATFLSAPSGSTHVWYVI